MAHHIQNPFVISFSKISWSTCSFPTFISQFDTNHIFGVLSIPSDSFQELRKYSTSTSKIYDIIGVINFPFICICPCICMCICLCICIFVQIWIADIISFQKYTVWGVPEAWRQCYSSSMNSGKIVVGRDGTEKSKVLQEVIADLKKASWVKSHCNYNGTIGPKMRFGHNFWLEVILVFLHLPLIEILAQGQKAGFSSLQLCCIFQGRVLIKQSFYLPFLNSPGRLVVQELPLCSSHRHVCGSHRTWVPQSNHPSSTFTIPCLATGWLFGTCIQWDGIGIWELAKIWPG